MSSCHKCGGFPGSKSKPRAKLVKCLECGTLTCNMHIGVGGKCPKCGNTRKQTVVTSGCGFGKKNKRERPKPKLLGARKGSKSDKSVDKGSKIENPLAAAGATLLRAGANALVDHLLSDYGGGQGSHEQNSNMIENNDKQRKITDQTTSGIGKEDSTGAQEQVEKSISIYGVDGRLNDKEVEDLEAEIALRQVAKASWHKVLSDTSFPIKDQTALDRFKTDWSTIADEKWQNIVILNTEATNKEFLAAFSNFIRNTPYIYGAIGYGPHQATEKLNNLNFDYIATIIQKTPEIIALGEIGIDLHFSPSTEAEQGVLFKKQLQFAADSGLTILMNTKKAAAQQLTILQQVRATHHLPPIIFTGTIDDKVMLNLCLENDCYVTIRPEITYEDADTYKDFLKHIPEERLLLSSGDALKPPHSHIGKYNNPSYISETAKISAELFNKPVDKFIRQVGENFKDVFPYIFEADIK